MSNRINDETSKRTFTMLCGNKKQHPCKYCNSKDWKSFDVNEHSKTHIYERACNKEHQCNYCESKDWESFDVNEHSKTHIYERACNKEHQCNYCESKDWKSFVVDEHSKDCNLSRWKQECIGEHSDCYYCRNNKLNYTKIKHDNWHYYTKKLSDKFEKEQEEEKAEGWVRYKG